MPVVVNYPPPSSVVVNEVTGAVTVVSAGPRGAAGSKIYSGITAPDPEIGAIGDYWFDKATKQMYGPKSQEDGWGTPIPLGGNPTLVDSVFSIGSPSDGDAIIYDEDSDTWEARAVRHYHSQIIPSATWVIDHNLNAYPGGVSVVDSAGSVVYGDVVYNSLNQLTINFTVQFSGEAYLS